MSKYIDAEAFFKLINTTFPYGELDYPDKAIYNAAISDMCGMLTHFPAADVAEVRHGRWIKKYRSNFLCSVCGAWFRTTDEYGNIIDGEMRAKYCEECGAKMDEVYE